MELFSEIGLVERHIPRRSQISCSQTDPLEETGKYFRWDGLGGGETQVCRFVGLSLAALFIIKNFDQKSSLNQFYGKLLNFVSP